LDEAHEVRKEWVRVAVAAAALPSAAEAHLRIGGASGNCQAPDFCSDRPVSNDPAIRA